MIYDYASAQNALTFLFQFVAIAWMVGIAMDMASKQHRAWMATYCPPVKAFVPSPKKQTRRFADIPSLA
jgi:hypothetical protein